MNSSNNIILNRFFTRNTFADLLTENFNRTYVEVINRYINDIETKSNRILISEIYKIMTYNYRNEYFYKNTLLNKLLLAKHSLKTTTALTEMPIGKSKADFILINGKAVVYEIKTELDSFERLENQLSDYYKAFDHVCVVTCEDNFDKLDDLLNNSPVGIYILTKRNTLSLRKEPSKDDSRLDSKIMFKLLRKAEFENIIKIHYGEIPVVSQVNHYNQCYKLFKNIHLEKSYYYMLNELKKRTNIEIEEYKNIPYELKFLAYFAKFKKGEYQQLNLFLNNEFGG
ncbi:hypothetical protein EDC14_10387 [Hydrogenispora ethanolica]|uniref:Sce7726 family protein n=1 Tax=Hydrogenispora ethanolica TaxID=1082276 RepID=A0A4R1R2T8_HYDET|nr:sce7726 family protein [Hydrogenispora ethanolica]TCL59714.1 hypothetical protein EDC14_10387 [Hydrogenispora ethanolica]